MKQLHPLVLENRSVASGYYELRFSWESDETPLPGQFVTLRVAERPTPLLRRPFAFSSFDPQRREAAVIYQDRGKGTREMVGYRTGDRLDLLGPLGHGFPGAPEGATVYLIAGGVGMGPIFFTAEERARAGGSSTLILGARSRVQLPDIEFSRRIRYSPCTDDGSAGFAGTSVDRFVTLLEKDSPAHPVIYTCGPEPMMHRLTEIAEEREIPIWVSMEQTMGCAVGACLGCAVRVKGAMRYARVCTEGPVFDGKEILWT
ncbi:MAG: dihydroorotate dehydrogenase electron transfer subunit [Spirochaetaceae bacterium]